MSKFKKTALCVLVLLFSVCLCAGIAACGKGFPNFRYPAGYVPPEESEQGKYVIYTKSEGGLKLDNVQVDVSLNGKPYISGISKNGRVLLNIEPDEYDLSFKSLPLGYSTIEGVEYRTSASERSYTALFRSSVITNSTVPTNKKYSIGDVMYEFALGTEENPYWTDTVTGENLVLSELLKDYKAIVLNFWYVDCPNCVIEFPAMYEAYQYAIPARDADETNYKNYFVKNKVRGRYEKVAEDDEYDEETIYYYLPYYEKIKVICINHDDFPEEINSFKTDLGLDLFSMTYEDTDPKHNQPTVYQAFIDKGYPTTAIIDRYGVMASWHQGGIFDPNDWIAMFSHFTADDYKQAADENAGGEGVGDAPDVVQPDSAILNAAASPSLNLTYSPETEDDEWYRWPWLASEEGYMYASNSGHNITAATVYTDITLEKDEAISLEYNVSSEDGKDILYVLINRRPVASYSGTSNGWLKEDVVYLANKRETVNLAFIYLKDAGDPVYSEGFEREDSVKIRNIEVYKKDFGSAAYDRRTAAAWLDTNNNVQYLDVAYDETTERYYVLDENTGTHKSILYVDMRNATLWTEVNCDGEIGESDDGTPRANFLHDIIYYDYGNRGVPLSINLGGKDYGRVDKDFYEMQGFSPNGLVPATKDMVDMIKDFTKAYSRDRGTVYSDRQWQQFCYYFEHYGTEHEDGLCYAEYDPTAGLSMLNPIRIDETGRFTVNVWAAQHERGPKYLFTVPETGVYLFESLYHGAELDPFIMLFPGLDIETFVEQESAVDYDLFDIDYDASAIRGEVTYKYDNNFRLYQYLEKGQQVYVAFTLDVDATGVYDVEISYAGEDLTLFRVCSTGDGAFTHYDNSRYDTYLAVPVGYDSDAGYYRHIESNGEYASAIYVDFLRSNFFEKSAGYSLYDMMKMGLFDIVSPAGENCNTIMLKYYYMAIDKDESDITYGMIEAKGDLVQAIQVFLGTTEQDSGSDSGAWEQFAYYFQYYGAE